MLYIKGAKCSQQAKMPNFIRDPGTTFNAYCVDGPCAKWVDTEFARRVITDIDRIDVRDTTRTVKSILTEHEVPLQDIATGSKNLILCKYFAHNGAVCYNRMGFMGENCFKYLVEASIDRDIYMVTTVFREFPKHDPFPEGACVCFEDNSYVAHNAQEWLKGMLDIGVLGVFEA